MKAIALALAGIVAATGCQGVLGHSVKGSGKPGSRTVSVGPGKTIGEFKRIQSNGSFDLEIKQGPQSDIVITGDDNLVDVVKLELDGDTLKVRTEGSWSSELGLKLSVTMPRVEGVSLNGSGNAKVTGLEDADIDLSISGSGEIKAFGKANKVSASISGSGDIDASQVEADDADASIAGSGSIKVDASKKLSASIAGSGDIRYKGSPSLSKTIAGSGEVQPL